MLAAFFMVVMVAVLALALDIGYMLKVKTDISRSVDAAALAGAGKLVDGVPAAEEAAIEFLIRNPIGVQTAVDEQMLQVNMAKFLADHKETLKFQAGVWDPNAVNADGSKGKMTLGADRPSAFSVTLTDSGHPYFFASIFGKSMFDISSEAVATYQPRDIMVVLDFSASMNDDSELKSINVSGLNREAVEANLLQIYQDLGSPQYGTKLTFTPKSQSSTNKTTLKKNLGIDKVKYPYPKGSWDEWLDYVMSSSEQPADAGYRKKYGYMTLINYWLDKYPEYAGTPDLWKTHEQPVATLKDAVDTFVDYVDSVDSGDRMGLAIYNASNGNGVVETGLTLDLNKTAQITRQRQAGHYHDYTNIAGGMAAAREELATKARPGAFRMMVLMTDGNANWYNGKVNESAARNAVLNEAQACKSAKIQVMTICVGASSDTSLLKQVADITGGKFFNVPGGSGIERYKAQLIDTFKSIADDRPLKLVH